MKRIIGLGLAAIFPLLAVPAAPASAATPAPIVGYQTAHLTSGMIRAINSIPCDPKQGSARIILYSVSNDLLKNAVRDKLKCGAYIKLLTSIQKPDGENEAKGVTPDVQDIINSFKEYKKPYKVSRGALARAGSAGLEHEKLVMIDRGGNDKYVLSDSGNWTFSTDNAYNDRMTVRDACLYKGSVSHFERLWSLKSNKSLKSDPPARSCDGKRMLYFMPIHKVDTLLNWAKSTKCGRGSTIVFSTFYLTSGSKTKYGSGSKLVTELIRFKKAGAGVSVAANDYKWSTSQRSRLIKAGIPVYKANVNKSKYMHRKAFASRGCSGGPYSEQGSTTRTGTAYMSNGNQIIVSRLDSDARAMISGYYSMVNGKSKFKK